MSNAKKNAKKICLTRKKKKENHYKPPSDIIEAILRHGELEYHGTVNDRHGNVYDVLGLAVLLLALRIGTSWKKRVNTTTIHFFRLPGSKRRGRPPKMSRNIGVLL